LLAPGHPILFEIHGGREASSTTVVVPQEDPIVRRRRFGAYEYKQGVDIGNGKEESEQDHGYPPVSILIEGHHSDSVGTHIGTVTASVATPAAACAWPSDFPGSSPPVELFNTAENCM